MTAIFQTNSVRHSFASPGALMLFAVFSTQAAAVQDVMLQSIGGKIVTGLVDDQSGTGTLGTRVYGRHFQLVSGTFRASNPGFFGLRTGDPGIPSGAAGFPANHDVNFDLLPMTNEDVSSNLFYWDGSDMNGGGVNTSDVNFVVPPAGVYWEQRDDNFSPYTANGSDQLVPGGLIDRSSTDIWADGIDSGTIHAHLAMLVNDSDGNSATQPPAGIYMIAWQARSAGFETSDPFFFVMRSPTISDAVRDIAVDWVEANIEMLTSPPGLPGDYNDDGSVDAADYIVWRKTFGQIGEELPADGDGSGEIDDGDLTVWKANFGNTQSLGRASSTAVPEAGTWPIIAAGLIGMAMIKNRRGNRPIRIAIRRPTVILDERVPICRRMERKGSL
jgi:hypothetical protein